MSERDTNLFILIQNGDITAVEQLYLKHREEFFKWAVSNFNCKIQDAEDVWQEAIITFFENVKNRRILVLRCSLCTYLFSIGKHILLNKLRKDNKIDLLGTFDEYEDRIDGDLIFNFDNVEKEASLTRYFDALGRKCKDLLISRFYLGKPIDVIRQETGLNNNNVVSASLSRCLNRLKDIIKSNNISNDPYE